MDDDEEWKKKVRYCIWQYEIAPETGRKHVQGYVELHTPVRIPGMKDLMGTPKAHLEGRKGTRDQARAYCQKADTRDPELGGPYEWGEWSGKGAGNRSDLTNAIQVLKKDGVMAVAREHPETFVRNHRGLRELAYTLRQEEAQSKLRNVTIIVLYGTPGAGKSHVCFQLAQRLKLVAYPVTPPNKGGPVWFNGYNGEKMIIMDDFSDWMDYQPLLRLTDKYPYQVQSKGGMIWAEWNLVVFTSMAHWQSWYHGTLFTGMNDPRALERRIHGSFRLLKRTTPTGSITRVAQRWEDGDPIDSDYDKGAAHDLDVMDEIELIFKGPPPPDSPPPASPEIVVRRPGPFAPTPPYVSDEEEEVAAPPTPPSPEIGGLDLTLHYETDDE